MSEAGKNFMVIIEAIQETKQKDTKLKMADNRMLDLQSCICGF